MKIEVLRKSIRPFFEKGLIFTEIESDSFYIIKEFCNIKKAQIKVEKGTESEEHFILTSYIFSNGNNNPMVLDRKQIKQVGLFVSTIIELNFKINNNGYPFL